MKKFLIVLTVLAVGLLVFGITSRKTDASKTLFNSGDGDERAIAKQISLEILRDRAARSIIGTPDDYVVNRVEIDQLKTAHTHFQQTHFGIPVFGGEVIVHLTPTGELASITDELKESIVVNVQPDLTHKQAIELALRSIPGHKLTERPTVNMWIYRGEGRDHLAYSVELPRLDGSDQTSAPVVILDAHSGDILDQYDNLKTGTGSSLYNGTVTISTSSSGSTFYMEDLTRRMGTFNMNSTGNESTGSGGTQSRFSGTDDVWNATIERAGVDAHYGAAKTFDYYQIKHGRNGIDGNFGPGTTTAAASAGTSLVSSRVHYGSSGRYNNAFWYQNMMSYGDGDGTTFSPLTTVDICGHEMTHGVIERTANLVYSRESGALNESFADIFGSMVELYGDGGAPTTNTWLIGEDSYTPGTSGDALRRMDNPNAVGDPDHYSVRLYPGTCTPSSLNDQCGVHTNSSISNHAFFLAAAGGTNRVSGVTVTGTGTSDAERIFYRALVTYMTSSTNFAGARTATLNAATDLFGSTSAQYNTIATAWCAVGVGSCPTGSTPTPTPTATPTPTPTPTATPTPTPTPTPGGNLLVNGSFETNVSPWVGSGTGYAYTSNGNYPQSGTGYIYFGIGNSRSGQSYQTVSIPTTAAGSLTFWLNVTSSETTTSTQYDRLFVEVRSTSGSLLATLGTYSNLNKATAGVYTQRTLTVPATYKGQTVRIQFRSTTDSSLVSTFRVDNVSLQ